MFNDATKRDEIRLTLLVVCSAPNYYLNHCWCTVDWTLGLKVLFRTNRVFYLLSWGKRFISSVLVNAVPVDILGPYAIYDIFFAFAQSFWNFAKFQNDWLTEQ